MSLANGLDDELVSELEETESEDLLAEYGGSGTDKITEKINFAAGFAPDADEWHGKTKIAPNQARNIAVALHLPKMLPGMEETEKWREEILTDYMILLTSVNRDGETNARDDIVSILKSMFGGASETDEALKSTALQMFANSDGDSSD